jgi:hypothetical protein
MKIKKRTLFIIIFAVCLCVGTGYVCWYLNLRLNKRIIHRKTWSSHNYHEVTVEFPDGRLILFGTLAISQKNNLSEKETKKLLDDAIKYNLRKTKYISFFSAPLRWMETEFWYIFDWERDD